jgi:beta-phosphoglucomutase family hydrolase
MFRKDLMQMLSHKPMSINEIARLLELGAREIEEDVRHLIKSLRHSSQRIVVTPAQCRKCGFVFAQNKLRKPGKCPSCHGTWIEEPMLHVERKSARERHRASPSAGRWGAIFDWDGVIIDSMRQHQLGWSQLAQAEGYTMPAGAFERGFGMKNDQIISQVLGWTEDPREIERLSRRKEMFYRSVLQAEGIEPLPGVGAWLASLRRAGVPCAVASSTEAENIRVVLRLLALEGCFQAIVSADDVVTGKPDPQVFLLAASKLGIPSQRCVVFEDAVVGIEAAHAAGMRVVALTTTAPASSLQAAERVVGSFDELQLGELAAWFKRC